MRPVYESDATKQVEREMVDRFIKTRGAPLTAEKMPLRYSLDFALTDKTKRVRAWVECKRRHHAREKFPTLLLSLGKWQEGCEFARISGRPFVLLVEWDDGLFYLMHKDVAEPIHTEFGGRSDRGDWQDREPVVHIPVDKFRKVETAQ